MAQSCGYPQNLVVICELEGDSNIRERKKVITIQCDLEGSHMLILSIKLIVIIGFIEPLSDGWYTIWYILFYLFARKQLDNFKEQMYIFENCFSFASFSILI